MSQNCINEPNNTENKSSEIKDILLDELYKIENKIKDADDEILNYYDFLSNFIKLVNIITNYINKEIIEEMNNSINNDKNDGDDKNDKNDKND